MQNTNISQGSIKVCCSAQLNVFALYGEEMWSKYENLKSEITVVDFTV